MKKLALIILILFSVHVFGQENPLLGEWEYDKGKTIQQINNSNVFSTEAKKNLLAGIPSTKINMVITVNTITYIHNNQKSESTYKIIVASSNFAKIEEYEVISNGTFTKTISIKGGIMLMSTGLKPSILMAFTKK